MTECVRGNQRDMRITLTEYIWILKGYCNSWEHAGSNPGPGVNPPGKLFPSKVILGQGRPRRLFPGKEGQSHRVRGQSQFVPAPEPSDPRNCSNPILKSSCSDTKADLIQFVTGTSELLLNHFLQKWHVPF